MNRFLFGLVAMTLALSACGGGGAEPAATPPASPSPSASPSPEISPSPAAEPSPTAAAPSPSPSPTKPSPTPPRPAPPLPNPPPPPPAAAALSTGPARAGQYLFNDTGEIRTLGCLTSNQAVPTPSRLNVQAPAGNRQQIDREQNGSAAAGGNGGPGFVTNIVFEYRDEGAFLVSLRQRQTFANQTVDIEFRADPPVLAIPSRPTLGQANSFTLRSTDGKVQVQTDTRIEGVNEPVTLAQGAVVKATKIRSSSRITGQSNQGTLNVAVDRTSWYATDSRIEVKDSTDTSGSVGLCRVDFSVQSLAQSV